MENCNITIEIKKSKFIGLSFFVENTEQIEPILSKLKHDYADATHICYAYVLETQEKCSDDGEPSGTAGKPILEVIKKMGLKNVLTVVVRYFGGVKLGAGGLSRAYSDCAVEVIQASKIAEYKSCESYMLTFSLGEEDKLFNRFFANGLNITKKYYLDVATYEVDILSDSSEKVLSEIAGVIGRNNYFKFLGQNYIKREVASV